MKPMPAPSLKLPPRPPGPRGTAAARTLARCAGAGFARQEVVLVLARLCRHYRLDLATPGLPRPRGLVTLRPARPVLMRLTRRR